MPPLQTQRINPRTKRLEEMAQRFVSPGGLREFYTKAIAEDLAALEPPPKLHRSWPGIPPPARRAFAWPPGTGWRPAAGSTTSPRRPGSGASPR